MKHITFKIADVPNGGAVEQVDVEVPDEWMESIRDGLIAAAAKEGRSLTSITVGMRLSVTELVTTSVPETAAQP